MLAKSLKAKFTNDELVLGLTLTNHCWPGYLEIIKSSGYDFVWLDCEHSPFTLQQVEEAAVWPGSCNFPWFYVRRPAVFI